MDAWTDVMFLISDVVGPGQVMVRDYSAQNAIVLVLYIFVAGFFIINLYVSVIVDKFNDEMKKTQGSINFTKEQSDWVKIQK